jgi:hypothetical protein
MEAKKFMWEADGTLSAVTQIGEGKSFSWGMGFPHKVGYFPSGVCMPQKRGLYDSRTQ